MDANHTQLPTEPPHAPEWSPRRSSVRKPIGVDRRHRPGEFRRALVAESDQALRVSLQRMLGGWGFEVMLAKTGTEALRLLRGQEPLDVAILGKKLTGIGGIELCRRINAQAMERMPYLLVLAKRGEARDAAEALESGADEYLTAPIETRELKARLAAASRILKRRNDLIVAREAFRDQARRDELTGVLTRRAILEFLEAELSRTGKNGRSAGVLMLDLDHFKSINDTYGHLAGDQILAETGRRLSRQLRSYDTIGRYGGEEFMVVAPGCDKVELCELAERLRTAIESAPMRAAQREIRVTLSIGAVIASEVDGAANTAIESADVALYAAKKAGRNRFVCSVLRPNTISHSLLCMPQIALQPSVGHSGGAGPLSRTAEY
jgi:two-component system, cell cycle response regulator